MTMLSAGRRPAVIAALAAAALLAGCNRGGSAPKGQVVATVNGDDITTHELNSELSLARPPASMPRKTVEAIVLDRVIERKILADVARDRKLDKNPDFILAQRRLDDNLLVQALQADIARKIPAPTREAAEKYIEAHPDQFGQRKIYTIDQIQFLRPNNITALGLEKANTMADVASVLTSHQIKFGRNAATVDALTVQPALVAEIGRILAKNPQEVFMFADQPQGAPAPVMYVNHVTDTKVVPFLGEEAIKVAQQILQRDNTRKALVDNLKAFRDTAKAKTSYAAGYGPPPAAPAVPAPGTPAPGTAAAVPSGAASPAAAAAPDTAAKAPAPAQ